MTDTELIHLLTEHNTLLHAENNTLTRKLADCEVQCSKLTMEITQLRAALFPKRQGTRT